MRGSRDHLLLALLVAVTAISLGLVLLLVLT
jgi:hypothetical protein